MPTNRRITLAARPVGYPKESDFNLVESPAPAPGPEQMMIRIIYLSLDPYMRGLMASSRGTSSKACSDGRNTPFLTAAA